MACPHLQGLPVELHGLLNEALLSLDVGQVVEGVCVCGAQAQSCVVALLRLRYLQDTETTFIREGITGKIICLLNNYVFPRDVHGFVYT